MVQSYVEDLTEKYYMKKGYLVNRNIWFKIPKEKTGKKVSGWSDIDIFALAPGEVVVVQCKSFIGTQKAEESAKGIITQFEYAINFLKSDDVYRFWLQGTKIKKVLVVDYTVKKAEKILKEAGIEIISYNNILRDLLSLLKKEQSKYMGQIIGKEEDKTLRLLIAMINKKFISKDVFEGRDSPC